MKTRFSGPIGLLAGLALSLTSPAASAQEHRPPPPPPRPGVEAANRDGMMGRARMVERMEAREAAERREERMLLQEAMESHRRGDPAEAGRLRDSLRSPVEKRAREAGVRKDLGKKPAQPLPPRAKIQHLRQAAEHLQAAGYPDYAEKARKEAERVMEQARKDSANDANPELTDKINKLSRQVEELRDQVRRLKDEKREPKPPKDKAPEAPPAEPRPQ